MTSIARAIASDWLETASATSASSASSAATASSATSGELPELSSKDGALAVTLTAAESQVPYAGSTRWAMTYNGRVSGPTLRVHPGDRLTVTLVNDLGKPTSLHTHGLHVSPEQDNPFVSVEPGQSYTYTIDIPANQQAGTYWYHPHVHESTAEQVASGLSGAMPWSRMAARPGRLMPGFSLMVVRMALMPSLNV